MTLSRDTAIKLVEAARRVMGFHGGELERAVKAAKQELGI